MKARIAHKNKLIFTLSLAMILVVQATLSVLVYSKLNSNVISQERTSQQRLSLIVEQLLSNYFFTFKYITKNAAAQKIFSPAETRGIDSLLYRKLTQKSVLNYIHNEHIKNILPAKRKSLAGISKDEYIAGKHNFKVWQVFKALPISLNGQPVAANRRHFSEKILQTYPDIHYVFQMKMDGDLLFLSPYSIQKNITSFNYAFRDYLFLVKKYKRTAVSEGYISNDQARTQIITVVSPIYNRLHRLVSFFAASVSAKMLGKNVFQKLQSILGAKSKSIIYLIDRHGHVVASSNDKNVYLPVPGKKSDAHDPGNVSELGFFKKFQWHNDFFEKGNRWQRRIKSWNRNSLKKSYSGSYVNLDGKRVLATFYPTSLGGPLKNWGILIETPLSSVLAPAKYFREIFIVSTACIFLVILSLYIFTLKSFNYLSLAVQNKQKELVKVTSQIVHDVKSPLVALNMSIDSLKGISEESRLVVRRAVERINDIINDLLSRYKEVTDERRVGKPPVPEIISTIVETMVSEKRMQYKNDALDIVLDISKSAYGQFVMVNASDFKRSLSNIINNSCEAIAVGDSGKIEITLNAKVGQLYLSIRDNGSGFDITKLDEILGGKSIGKIEGKGLGLSFAVGCLRAWGCDVNINSTVGEGTAVDITMPISTPADWFRDVLHLEESSTLVVIDDDESIHGVWDYRLKELNLNLKVEHFTSPEEFLPWFSSINKDLPHTYLIDYEFLNSKKTGLNIAEIIDAGNRATLVTSHFENVDIKNKAYELGVKIIPKEMSLHLPIQVVDCSAEYVLIEDDEMLSSLWVDSFAKSNLKLIAFKRFGDFYCLRNSFSKKAKIYLDSDLKDNLTGEQYAKMLHGEGFFELYITTGNRNLSVKDLPWIRQVVGKEPPL